MENIANSTNRQSHLSFQYYSVVVTLVQKEKKAHKINI